MMTGQLEWSIVFYTTAEGAEPVWEFLESLDQKTRTRFEWSIEQLRVRHVDATEPLVKHIAGKIRELRRLVAEGAIGQPLAVRLLHVVYLPPHLQGWRVNRPDAGGGIILDITVHDADTLRFVLDDEVEEVFACPAQQGLATSDLEDAVMGVMSLHQGTQAQ